LDPGLLLGWPSLISMNFIIAKKDKINCLSTEKEKPQRNQTSIESIFDSQEHGKHLEEAEIIYHFAYGGLKIKIEKSPSYPFSFGKTD
jgi:hypothetical protein